MEAYCVKCRSKKEIKNAKAIHDEKRQTSDPGRMPLLRDEDVSYWQL